MESASKLSAIKDTESLRDCARRLKSRIGNRRLPPGGFHGRWAELLLAAHADDPLKGLAAIETEYPEAHREKLQRAYVERLGRRGHLDAAVDLWQWLPTRDASGNPVPASRIVLQWSHEAGGVTTSSTRRTAADTQGHFAFSNLGPGPHSLRVDAPGFGRVDLDHDLSRQGYAVTVKLN